MEEGIVITRQDAQYIKNLLRQSEIDNSKKIADDLELKLGDWRLITPIAGQSLGRAELIELLSLDHKTSSLAVIVNIPDEYPMNCLALLEERDGKPCFVPMEQYAGWRPFEYIED
jgi:hypothetical protein